MWGRTAGVVHAGLTWAAITMATAAGTVTASQVVFLDFDTHTVPGKYEYTTTDRALVKTALESIYGEFPVTFTTVLPPGPHSTIYFNFGDGPYGGTSDQIDFRNLDKTDNAYVLAPDLLSALDVPLTTPNILRASANLAAHELGHILGLRHHDAFGPPLSGVGVSPASFSPAFPGPMSAHSTSLHVMGLASSVSLNATTIVSPHLHLNFRSAIKLSAIDHPGLVVPEVPSGNNTPPDAQALSFTTLTVPNTMLGFPDGFIFHDPTFSVRAVSVLGHLDSEVSGVPPVLTDYFKFTGRAGDIVTIEVMSVSLAPRFDNVTNPVLILLDDHGLPVPHYGGFAANNDEFETTDSLLLDVLLPYTGTYYIEVGPVSPLSLANTGSYEMFVYSYRLIPEPSSLALAVAGLAIACAGLIHRRRSRT